MLDWKYVFARMTQNTLSPVGMMSEKRVFTIPSCCTTR